MIVSQNLASLPTSSFFFCNSTINNGLGFCFRIHHPELSHQGKLCSLNPVSMMMMMMMMKRRNSFGLKKKAEMRRAVRMNGMAHEDKASSSPVSTPEAAVELGLSLFRKGRVRDALFQFDLALTMEPNPEEAQAALYNKACCHARRDEDQMASESLRRALREYGLKFSVILNDPDLANFRGTIEFKKLQEEARKGGQEVGPGFRRDLKLIGEVQAPFRGVRKLLYAVFSAAAGISTIINGPRLFRAIQGGDNAPDLLETVQNLGINLAGIIVFVALFIWESRKEEEQLARISRDETLSRLPLRLSKNRVIELVQLRNTCRPLILAGGKDTVMRAIQRSERFRSELLERGVLLIPLIWNSTKEEPSKKGFGGSGTPLSANAPAADDFEARAKSIALKTVEQAERSFKAEVISPLEWERWVQEEQEAKGVTLGADVYIVLRLDGRVRKSGVGMPDWAELVKELPPLNDLVSKLER